MNPVRARYSTCKMPDLDLTQSRVEFYTSRPLAAFEHPQNVRPPHRLLFLENPSSQLISISLDSHHLLLCPQSKPADSEHAQNKSGESDPLVFHVSIIPLALFPFHPSPENDPPFHLVPLTVYPQDMVIVEGARSYSGQSRINQIDRID